jgi:hypothetical protein
MLQRGSFVVTASAVNLPLDHYEPLNNAPGADGGYRHNDGVSDVGGPLDASFGLS